MTENKLHIAIIADPEIPIPPVHYGGIERIIHGLIGELKREGHLTSLFAHPDSLSPADHFYPYRGDGQGTGDILRNTFRVSRLLWRRPDIIHSFGRLAYLSPLLPLRVPKVMSYQREPTIRQIRRAAAIAARGSLVFTGCSDYISRQIAPYAPAATVYNAVPLDAFRFREDPGTDAPLVFLGRIEPIKGTHLAIQAALACGRKLVIAGNVPDYGRAYFDREVAPYLHAGRVEYAGPVDDRQKDDLLGSAAALLMPVQWNEPFGIVMAEALACGTPVIALKGGATTEVVIHGVNGFLCDTVADMASAVGRLDTIARAACRMDAERRFSSAVIAADYMRIYRKIMNRAVLA